MASSPRSAAGSPPNGRKATRTPSSGVAPKAFHRGLAAFDALGTPTTVGRLHVPVLGDLPSYTNAFWPTGPRDANPIHGICHGESFAPGLPSFFIGRLTSSGDVVHDPFMGRGTTPVAAALAGRVPFGSDLSPLSVPMTAPRLDPPNPHDVQERLREIDYEADIAVPEELLVFYHPTTLSALCNLRRHLLEREGEGGLDPLDAWIRMVATTRLAGHSGGFFSARGKPPNQAVSVASQRRLNRERHQVPPYRNIPALVLRKTFSLLEDLGPEERETLRPTAAKARLLTAPCEDTSALPSGSVALVVTAPPSPDARDFRADHWLRCWFHGTDPGQVPFPDLRNALVWGERMKDALGEVHRVLRPGGRLALVVPEVRRVRTDLLAPAAAAGMSAGLAPELVLVHVRNFDPMMSFGEGKGLTGTRILVFRKE